MSACAASAGLPWLAPCCADCARGREAGGADTSPAAAGTISTGTGALLVLAAIGVAVLYGDKFLRKLGA